MHTTLIALRAVAEETRLRLLLLLARGELTVGELADCVDQSQPRVSRHLKLLVEAGLLLRFQEGTQVFYRLAGADQHSWILDGVLAHGGSDDFAADRARRDAIISTRQDRARRYFETHAKTWNYERRSLIDADAVEDAVHGMAAPAAGDTLLDIGTGTGRMLEVLGAEVSEAQGLDMSREMLAIARSSLTAGNYAHISLRQGDIYKMPVSDAYASLVSIHQVLHYMEDPAAALREAARVMHPGGRMVLADYLPHSDESLRRDHAHRRLGFSDTEIQQLAGTASLQVSAHSVVSAGQLPVGIWRLEHKETH